MTPTPPNHRTVPLLLESPCANLRIIHGSLLFDADHDRWYHEPLHYTADYPFSPPYCTWRDAACAACLEPRHQLGPGLWLHDLAEEAFTGNPLSRWLLLCLAPNPTGHPYQDQLLTLLLQLASDR